MKLGPDEFGVGGQGVAVRVGHGQRLKDRGVLAVGELSWEIHLNAQADEPRLRADRSRKLDDQGLDPRLQ
ncbi:hypothetical protein [Streptomyces microflavus]|uniref:hypothetical protein n=1 Tax=Streptomyces microflavus TaxID=1919 RepID=UPI0036971890